MACFSSACSPVKVLNSLVPGNGYELVSDVEYGENSRQKLDIYIPKNPKTLDVQKLDALKKVIIFYYGGNWDSGERADYKFAAEALVSQGLYCCCSRLPCISRSAVSCADGRPCQCGQMGKNQYQKIQR